MAYKVHAQLPQCEVRRVTETKTKKGEDLLLLKCEDYDGNDFEVSVRNPDLIASCRSLRKADMVDLDVLCTASTEWSYISLLSVPMKYEG